ncbi:MAG: hypothetical protein DHS20C01_23520 [marine bacterium B5-7]|nr:MAG: hypothetical protein DHS20C01_23520 [marine bacterium B5-7]
MPVRKKFIESIALTLLLFVASNAGASPDDDARAAYDSRDYATAYQIWSDLAEQNDGRAQYALGVMSATGSGREKNPTEAFEWFSKAAENGHVKAMYNLGIAYWTGVGTLEDHEEATHWWRMAAERGDMVSQYNLGIAYYNGMGVNQDIVEATRWIRASAKQNYVTAIELLPTLEEKLRETTPVADTASTTTAEESASTAPATPPGSAPSTTADVSDTSNAPATGMESDKPIDADLTAGFVKVESAEVRADATPNAPVLEQLPRGAPVKVIESRQGWSHVEAPGGFKMWVFGKYVTGDGDQGRINGEAVRSRSLPSTSDKSISLGSFKKGDAVRVLKTEGSWKQVQGPAHLSAWIKSSNISVLKAPTESWAKRWKQDGGTIP